MADAFLDIGYHFSEKELIRKIKVGIFLSLSPGVAQSLQASAIDIVLGVHCPVFTTKGQKIFIG